MSKLMFSAVEGNSGVDVKLLMESLRAGANEATIPEVDKEVTIGGTKAQ